MRGTVQWLRIEGGSNVDIESCTRFVSFVVLDQNGSDAVLELYALVSAIVAFGLEDFCVGLHF